MRSFKSRRGSLLIVAMLLSAIIAIFLTSYVQLSLNALNLSNRSFYSNAAMNLVDTGLEQAMWAINNSNNWTGAGFSTYSTGQYRGTFPSSTTSYSLSGGAAGQVKVWANPTGANPEVVAEAIITLPTGNQIIKEAEIYMTQSSFFKDGLVAKNTITFSGNNASVDSWNSSTTDAPTGQTPITAPVPYISSGVYQNATDSGKIGSTSVAVDSLSISNANINGYAAVGGNSSSDLSVGAQGYVGPYGTANGTINPAYVTYDFTTSFPDASAPTNSSITLSAISGATSLPRAGDSGVSVTSSGVTTTTYYYNVSTIGLSGNGDILTIGGSSTSTSKVNVVITLTNPPGATDVAITGKGGITIAKNATLAMYAPGNVSIAGNGITNGTYDPSSALSSTNTPNQPSAFQFYGTETAAQATANGDQTISISGNGVLSGVVYAPNANISMNGGGNSGQVLGAMVGNSVSVTGNSAFHYDTSLASLGSSGLWSLSKWRELYTSTDRNTYATQLNF
jgi:hypothetical protein